MAEKHCESCGTELYDETELIEGDEYETCEGCKESLICANCQAEAIDNGGNPDEEMELCPLCHGDMTTPVAVTRCVKCRHFDEGISEHCRLCGGENRRFECCEDCISDHWHWIDGEANGGTAREEA